MLFQTGRPECLLLGGICTTTLCFKRPLWHFLLEKDCGIARVEDPLGDHCSDPCGGWEQGGSSRDPKRWSDFRCTLKVELMWISERLSKLITLGGTLEIVQTLLRPGK